MKKLLFLILLLLSFNLSAQHEVVLCTDNATEFTYTTSSFNGTYTWTLNGTTMPSNSNFITIDWKNYGEGTYHLEVNFTDNIGCIAEPVTYDVYVSRCPDFNIWIPNAFTPDGDITNDHFTVDGYGFDLASFTMEIYDRWGEKLYRTTDINKPWSGRCETNNNSYPIGVYVYLIQLTDDNGRRREYVGTVAIVK